MLRDRNHWLIVAGGLSLAASLLHAACVVGGGKWYRFLGAGEAMASAAERGEAYPAITALTIAAMLAIAAAYAFAGAGVICRLPLIRTALVCITTVYLARGLVILQPSLLHRSDLSASFLTWSSLVVLIIGVIHAIGTWRAWPRLSNKGWVDALGS